ncbi:hypothetical protein [Paenibacillus sp. UMB4589-SE434]|uniref:hypothetical protein n=1 Tax=Paenibacillus sp. UMB4589-SE434 TaxID=3046314 RepID=UPI00254CECD0|nr:hypothetical protein [Paenibacillus sp. UMB4589-SE434]MDK8180022.1 hypothetical protein [Paenibacillus sp. UMB4589-SE434]
MAKIIAKVTPAFTLLDKSLIERYAASSPSKWGENISSAQTHLATKERVIACGEKKAAVTMRS